MSGTAITELARWAETQLPTINDRAVAAIVAQIPLYQNEECISRAELHRAISRNIRLFVQAFQDLDRPQDLTAAKETGRRRAYQGVPLPEVIRAYRIGFTTLWDGLVARAQDSAHSASGDALLASASALLNLVDEHAVALTESYRAAQAELLLRQQERRAALVEALLTGHSGPDGGPMEAAALLAMPPDARFVVVAADTLGLAKESLPGIERRLAESGISSAWRLTPALQLGIVALRADQHDVALKVLRDSATARTGVSPSCESLIDSPRALQLARSALARIPTGQAEVRVFSSSPLEALMVRSPGESRRLIKQVLGPVLELPAEDRAILINTLRAYFEHAGSTEATGAFLHCHANTVRYRLRRLQDLTGRSLQHPLDTAELATATYALLSSDDGQSELQSPRIR